MAVCIRYLNTCIIIFCHVHITQELPVQNIRTEITVVCIFCLSICRYKYNFHTKPATFIHRRFRKCCSESPGIHHVGIAFFSCEIQFFDQTFFTFIISNKFENMIVKSRNPFIYFGRCFTVCYRSFGYRKSCI